ncbi:MAG TPA: alpha/beta hydrolase [Cyclobacteriaceae bacterium]|nr:alpha/beta hydrolase [Cyclobacteriaceae bacterium]
MKKKNKIPFLLRIIPVVYPWAEKLTPWLANRFFVYLFFTPLNFKTPEKELKAETFSETFTLTVHGKKIQCYRWGNSTKTILVAHGWAGRATQFRRFVKPFLKAGYQVVGFDGPAHGKSGGKKTSLTEFADVIQEIVKHTGNVRAIVAHSFGGAASLYAIAHGLPVKTLVNIASPTIGDEVIKTFLRAINGSPKTGEAFKKYILKKFGKPFDEFSSLESIKHVPSDFNLLLVHDEGDKDVILEHSKELMKRYLFAKLLQTKGLGHTRILKDDQVIRDVVTFVERHSSNS